jgi:integrase
LANQSLDRDELQALLAAAKRKRSRDWLMILIAFAHGLRASEVVALTPHNFSKTHITVQRLKGSEKTTQALVESKDPLLNERAAVIEYLRKVSPNQRLFEISRVRFWQVVQEHGAAAGIAEHKRHPHVLKHSLGMQMIDSAGIHRTQKRLGHKSMNSTAQYLKVSDEDADKAVAGVLAL